MYSERSRKKELFSIPILYFLFCVYLFGSICGTIIANGSEILFAITDTRLSVIGVFLRCFIYYASIIFLSKTWAGLLLIPTVLFVRGFTFSVTILSVMQWSKNDIIEVIVHHGVPALIQIIGMFYLATVSFMLSHRRIRYSSINAENINEVRSGVLYAIIATMLCSAISLI